VLSSCFQGRRVAAEFLAEPSDGTRVFSAAMDHLLLSVAFDLLHDARRFNGGDDDHERHHQQHRQQQIAAFVLMASGCNRRSIGERRFGRHRCWKRCLLVRDGNNRLHTTIRWIFLLLSCLQGKRLAVVGQHVFHIH
jgi:hypothetical protein